jgi:hypothetical protein
MGRAMFSFWLADVKNAHSTDRFPSDFEFKNGTVHFPKHCVLLGVLADVQKSSNILKIYNISKFLERQNYLNIRSSGTLGHVDL